MELSFLSYIKIIRLNIIKIIFFSFFFSSFVISFSSLNNVLGKIYIEIENVKIQDFSKVFEDLNIQKKESQKIQNEILLLTRNFEAFNLIEFIKFKSAVKSNLEKNEIIRYNHLKNAVEHFDLKYTIKNIYFDDKIKREIVEVVNREYQNYQYILLKQFKESNLDLLLPEILQKIKKREDEYASIKNNLSQLSKTKLICFDNCFYVLQKNDVTIPEKEEEYFYLENKELKLLYDTIKKIDINASKKKIEINISFFPQGPMFSKFELFIFIFLMTFSLSAIFFLLKKNLDEKYRRD